MPEGNNNEAYDLTLNRDVCRPQTYRITFAALEIKKTPKTLSRRP